ncbi:unnamed protein product [Merluccius merluccius]
MLPLPGGQARRHHPHRPGGLLCRLLPREDLLARHLFCTPSVELADVVGIIEDWPVIDRSSASRGSSRSSRSKASTSAPVTSSGLFSL